MGMQRQVDLSPPADTSPYASPYTDSGPYATPYASAYGRRPVGYRCGSTCACREMLMAVVSPVRLFEF